MTSTWNRHLTLPSETVYFVSDAHLGGSSPDREAVKRERLHALLDRVEREETALLLLGDLFDFWFDYRTVIPKAAFGILARLDSMARRQPVHFLGGNHDFWMMDFLARETAVGVLADGALLECQGRRAVLYHGDGLGPGDRGYKVLKRVLRNPLAIWLFRWIHPDLGIRLGLHSSGVSRSATSTETLDADLLFRTVALPELRARADAVLMGHHHTPVHLTRPEGEFLILGDWFEHFSCVRLRGGKFEVLTWPLPGEEEASSTG